VKLQRLVGELRRAPGEGRLHDRQPGNDNAINLRGCYGDGDLATVDLILDVRGNGGSVGTAYDVVRIGQNAHDLVVTGNAECGARNSDPSIHQDIVQALSGSRITFVDFTSGDPFTGRWTCWGAGGGWYITWANAGIPTDLICLRCILATYNQNLRIGEHPSGPATRSSASAAYGIFVESVAQSPVNENNRVIRYRDPPAPGAGGPGHPSSARPLSGRDVPLAS
jgi:hypothetical protein